MVQMTVEREFLIGLNCLYELDECDIFGVYRKFEIID